MIRSFKCAGTARLSDDRPVRRFHSIGRVARRKLLLLHRAVTLEDLRVPPVNHLEALRVGRAGAYSIRVNDQRRICFAWEAGDVLNVEIVDYR